MMGWTIYSLASRGVVHRSVSTPNQRRNRDPPQTDDRGWWETGVVTYSQDILAPRGRRLHYLPRLQGLCGQEYFANYFLHSSDVTLNLKDNETQVHHRHAEPWKVSLVDTGELTQTGAPP